MTLAMFGGNPVRERPFHPWPIFDEHERNALLAVLDSGRWWTNHCGAAVGKEVGDAAQCAVARFQRAFADFHQAGFGVACTNGTAAIEIALKALGVQPGDEVICPPYSFVATAAAILHVGGIPVFVDIDAETYNLDAKRIEEAISPRTVGLLPVHFGGQAADMGAILDIAGSNGLWVLEDAAHAHGGMWRERYCGTMGQAGTFSFQFSKNMTAGEGGIILANDPALAERIEGLVWCGRKHGHPWYEFFELGSNYRMTEFQAAILLAQLERLEEQTRHRDQAGVRLNRLLAEIPGLTPMRRLPDTTRHTQHVYMVRYNPAAWDGLDRAVLLRALEAEGIPVSAGYAFSLFDNPMFLEQSFWNGPFPVNLSPDVIDFAGYRSRCPVSQRACQFEAIWLPQSLLLGPDSDLDDVAEAFRKVHQHRDRLATPCVLSS